MGLLIVAAAKTTKKAMSLIAVMIATFAIYIVAIIAILIMLFLMARKLCYDWKEDSIQS